MTQELDRAALKNQALLEKIAQMTAQYEDQVADLRVALTVSEQARIELEQRDAGTEKEDAA